MDVAAQLSDALARIEALQEALVRATDRIEILEAEKMGVGVLTPVEWGLTGKECRLFGVLMARESCTKVALMNALYDPGADDEPHIKIIDVFVCKLRKKLEAHGVWIETIWGQGYFIGAKSKALARQLMANSPGAIAA